MALTLDIKQDLRYKQGEKQGEMQKALEIASHMLKKGLDKNLIAETTGLSLSEIEKLEKDFGNK